VKQYYSPTSWFWRCYVTVEKQTLEALAFEKQTKNKDFDEKWKLVIKTSTQGGSTSCVHAFVQVHRQRTYQKYGATFEKC
jgi:hypothetical protein